MQKAFFAYLISGVLLVSFLSYCLLSFLFLFVNNAQLTFFYCDFHLFFLL